MTQNWYITGMDDVEDTGNVESGDINRAKFYYKMKNAKKVTFVGDSLTAGSNNGGHGWFEPLQTVFPKATFINKGVGGNGTVDVINRLTDITSSGADLYILAVGANDVRYQDTTKGATTPADYKTNMQTIITALKNVGGDVVVIELWPAFDNDTGSTLGYMLRDRTAKLYSASAKEYCGANAIPYIEVFDDLKNAMDFGNRASFLSDYIHPNSTIGIQLYSDEVLFGKRTSQNYGITRTNATAPYMYKLEILSAVGGTSFDLQTLTSDKSLVNYTYTTCNKTGKNDVSQIFNVANTTYHFQNDANDFPVVVFFGTSAPLKLLTQTYFTAGIAKYRLFESIDPSARLQFNHPSWQQIAGHEWYGAIARKNLYNAEQQITPVLNTNWSDRYPGNYRTKGDMVYVSGRWGKTTAWASGELILTLPAPYRPPFDMVVPAQIQLGAGTDFQMAFISVKADGTITCPGRTTNPSGYDMVQTSFSFDMNA